MPQKSKPGKLVVEGKDDLHVVLALCTHYALPETFDVVTPGDAGGVDALIAGIPVRLKESGVRAIGIVLDADQDAQARWAAVTRPFVEVGYTNIPLVPTPDGTVVEFAQRPRIGIWMMPNNQVSGMLEDFVAHLLPQNDQLLPRARTTVQALEDEGVHRHALVHRSKAVIHTWLAWQQQPGHPLGLAITANVLMRDATLARAFADWLRRLFASPS